LLIQRAPYAIVNPYCLQIPRFRGAEGDEPRFTDPTGCNEAVPKQRGHHVLASTKSSRDGINLIKHFRLTLGGGKMQHKRSQAKVMDFPEIWHDAQHRRTDDIASDINNLKTVAMFSGVGLLVSFEMDGCFDSLLSREQLCYCVAVMGGCHGFN
jgi:hypothetical protein